MKTYLEFNDGKSYKFWEITVDGNNHTVTYGKIGTDGQTKTKEFDSPEASNKDAEKLIKGKKKKGYKEKTEKSEKKISRRVAVHYEEEEEGKTIKMKLEKLAADPKAKEMTDLTIGSWGASAENTSSAIISFLVDNKSAFPNMKSVYIGDMNYEECEISWIQQSDMTPLLEAYPGLEELRIK
ncbi:MAG: WGR domain-containing protein, partial [bacterium]|nr:WGR domain-containing protein [bacterium]